MTTDAPDFSRVLCLTEREYEVFRLLGQGLLLRQVAERVGCSPSTAFNHQERIASKLGIKGGNRPIVSYAAKFNASEYSGLKRVPIMPVRYRFQARRTKVLKLQVA